MIFEALRWGQKYVTGVKEIDLQHHYFMELINRIAVELASAEDLSYRERLMSELGKYASFHFLSEENLMIKVGYPGLEQHLRLHKELLDHLSFHRLQDTPEKFLEFLMDWFLRHTVNEDRKIGDYLQVPNGRDQHAG